MTIPEALLASGDLAAIGLYALLAHHANDGICHLSYTEIAAIGGVSRPTAIKLIRTLVELKAITKQSRISAAGCPEINVISLVGGSKKSLPPLVKNLYHPLHDYKGVNRLVNNSNVVNVNYREDILSNLSCVLEGGVGETPMKINTKNQKPKSTSPVKNRRKTYAPDTLEITDQMRTLAVGYGVPENQLAEETERFLDWHRSNGNQFVDWIAAWRNWMRRVKRFEPKPFIAASGAAPIIETTGAFDPLKRLSEQ